MAGQSTKYSKRQITIAIITLITVGIFMSASGALNLLEGLGLQEERSERRDRISELENTIGDLRQANGSDSQLDTAAYNRLIKLRAELDSLKQIEADPLLSDRSRGERFLMWGYVLTPLGVLLVLGAILVAVRREDYT